MLANYALSNLMSICESIKVLSELISCVKITDSYGATVIDILLIQQLALKPAEPLAVSRLQNVIEIRKKNSDKLPQSSLVKRRYVIN